MTAGSFFFNFFEKTRISPSPRISLLEMELSPPSSRKMNWTTSPSCLFKYWTLTLSDDSLTSCKSWNYQLVEIRITRKSTLASLKLVPWSWPGTATTVSLVNNTLFFGVLDLAAEDFRVLLDLEVEAGCLVLGIVGF